MTRYSAPLLIAATMYVMALPRARPRPAIGGSNLRGRRAPLTGCARYRLGRARQRYWRAQDRQAGGAVHGHGATAEAAGRGGELNRCIAGLGRVSEAALAGRRNPGHRGRWLVRARDEHRREDQETAASVQHRDCPALGLQPCICAHCASADVVQRLPHFAGKRSTLECRSHSRAGPDARCKEALT